MSFVDYPEKLNKVRRQLNHILNDNRYYQSDASREFTISMYNAFGKRKITARMQLSMDKIIAQYVKMIIEMIKNIFCYVNSLWHCVLIL